MSSAPATSTRGNELVEMKLDRARPTLTPLVTRDHLRPEGVIPQLRIVRFVRESAQKERATIARKYSMPSSSSNPCAYCNIMVIRSP